MIFEGRPFMQAPSGRLFPLVNPEPRDVWWPDIIHNLAHCNRYAGSAGVYSVAQHSELVADQLPTRFRIYGLLHDAEEFAIGDITTPTKLAMVALGGAEVGTALKRMKEGIRRAIFLRAGLPWPVLPEIDALVKAADLRAMVTEKRDLLPDPIPAVSDQEWLHGYASVPPLPQTVSRWPIAYASRHFGEALALEGIIEGENDR